MKISAKIGDKEFSIAKLTPKNYCAYLSSFSQISDRPDGLYVANDIEVICAVIVAAFENQFSKEELLEKADISEILAIYLSIEAEVQNSTSNKIEEYTKNFTKSE